MNNLPNLKHLQYLLALHQHQHFHRAAQACFVSQSTLSSAILKLEEQIKCQIVERDNKSFIFTPLGNELVEMARQILVSANEFVSYAKNQGSEFKGNLKVGCIPTIAPYLLPKFVRECSKALPNVSLFLKEDTTDNLMQQLSEGEIDLIILALPIKDHHFKTQLVGQDAFYIAGEQALIDQYLQHHNYQALPEQSIFLLSEEHCLTEHALSACQLQDTTRINHFSASSITTLVQMTSFHRGFTFLPEMAVNAGVGKTENMAIAKMSDNMYRDIAMLWRPTSYRQQLYIQLSSIAKSLISCGK